MAYQQEIERKFLINEEKLPDLPGGSRLVQGYLSFKPTVRVRTEEGPDNQRKAYITIKGEGVVGRDEFEYDIPFDDAQKLLKMAQASLVSKTRYRLVLDEHPDLKWEIDWFVDDNAGLVVAELEMPDENFDYPKPDWLGQEVTEDPAYRNSNLAQHPYKDW